MELHMSSTPFDAEYVPFSGSRLTTNFANLAKDPHSRSERIGATLSGIGNRFHELMGEAKGSSRYQLEWKILTFSIRFPDGNNEWFPMTETLRCVIRDRFLGIDLPGPTGCNYSSYVRDHDFNVLLPKVRSGKFPDSELTTFGNLHGLLFRILFQRFHPKGILLDPMIMALSVANGREYHRGETVHPVLGREYLASCEESLTSRYFAKMGLVVSYFMAAGSRAPLAFYHEPGDLLKRPATLLAALTAVMEVFESIYRPEIYCARKPAGEVFKPDLANMDFDEPPAIYNRVERDTSRGREQAQRADKEFLIPNSEAITRFLIQYEHLLTAI